MRNTERLTKLKGWIEEELCRGRRLKTPGENMKLDKITMQEPKCHLGWAPARVDENGNIYEVPASVIPGIIVMPNQAYAKYMEDQRFDRYNNVHRPAMMGQHLAVSILFGVYEPGIRLPGFVESMGEYGQGAEISLLKEGTEEGLFTLLNWMDDGMTKLLGQKMIPGTDLYVEETTMTYSLYTDQSYVVDRRPIYYGFINVSFGCYAEEGVNQEIRKYLS